VAIVYGDMQIYCRSTESVDMIRDDPRSNVREDVIAICDAFGSRTRCIDLSQGRERSRDNPAIIVSWRTYPIAISRLASRVSSSTVLLEINHLDTDRQTDRLVISPSLAPFFALYFLHLILASYIFHQMYISPSYEHPTFVKGEARARSSSDSLGEFTLPRQFL